MDCIKVHDINYCIPQYRGGGINRLIIADCRVCFKDIKDTAEWCNYIERCLITITNPLVGDKPKASAISKQINDCEGSRTLGYEYTLNLRDYNGVLEFSDFYFWNEILTHPYRYQIGYLTCEGLFFGFIKKFTVAGSYVIEDNYESYNYWDVNFNWRSYQEEIPKTLPNLERLFFDGCKTVTLPMAECCPLFLNLRQNSSITYNTVLQRYEIHLSITRAASTTANCKRYNRLSICFYYRGNCYDISSTANLPGEGFVSIDTIITTVYIEKAQLTAAGINIDENNARIELRLRYYCEGIPEEKIANGPNFVVGNNAPQQDCCPVEMEKRRVDMVYFDLERKYRTDVYIYRRTGNCLPIELLQIRLQVGLGNNQWSTQTPTILDIIPPLNPNVIGNVHTVAVDRDAVLNILGVTEPYTEPIRLGLTLVYRCVGQPDARAATLEYQTIGVTTGRCCPLIFTLSDLPPFVLYDPVTGVFARSLHIKRDNTLTPCAPYAGIQLEVRYTYEHNNTSITTGWTPVRNFPAFSFPIDNVDTFVHHTFTLEELHRIITDTVPNGANRLYDPTKTEIKAEFRLRYACVGATTEQTDSLTQQYPILRCCPIEIKALNNFTVADGQARLAYEIRKIPTASYCLRWIKLTISWRASKTASGLASASWRDLQPMSPAILADVNAGQTVSDFLNLSDADLRPILGANWQNETFYIELKAEAVCEGNLGTSVEKEVYSREVAVVQECCNLEIIPDYNNRSALTRLSYNPASGTIDSLVVSALAKYTGTNCLRNKRPTYRIRFRRGSVWGTYIYNQVAFSIPLPPTPGLDYTVTTTPPSFTKAQIENSFPPAVQNRDDLPLYIEVSLVDPDCGTAVLEQLIYQPDCCKMELLCNNLLPNNNDLTSCIYTFEENGVRYLRSNALFIRLSHPNSAVNGGNCFAHYKSAIALRFRRAGFTDFSLPSCTTQGISFQLQNATTVQNPQNYAITLNIPVDDIENCLPLNQRNRQDLDLEMEIFINAQEECATFQGVYVIQKAIRRECCSLDLSQNLYPNILTPLAPEIVSFDNVFIKFEPPVGGNNCLKVRRLELKYSFKRIDPNNPSNTFTSAYVHTIVITHQLPPVPNQARPITDYGNYNFNYSLIEQGFPAAAQNRYNWNLETTVDILVVGEDGNCFQKQDKKLQNGLPTQPVCCNFNLTTPNASLDLSQITDAQTIRINYTLTAIPPNPLITNGRMNVCSDIIQELTGGSYIHYRVIYLETPNSQRQIVKDWTPTPSWFWLGNTMPSLPNNIHTGVPFNFAAELNSSEFRALTDGKIDEFLKNIPTERIYIELIVRYRCTSSPNVPSSSNVATVEFQLSDCCPVVITETIAEPVDGSDDKEYRLIWKVLRPNNCAPAYFVRYYAILVHKEHINNPAARSQPILLKEVSYNNGVTSLNLTETFTSLNRALISNIPQAYRPGPNDEFVVIIYAEVSCNKDKKGWNRSLEGPSINIPKRVLPCCPVIIERKNVPITVERDEQIANTQARLVLIYAWENIITRTVAPEDCSVVTNIELHWRIPGVTPDNSFVIVPNAYTNINRPAVQAIWMNKASFSFTLRLFFSEEAWVSQYNYPVDKLGCPKPISLFLRIHCDKDFVDSEVIQLNPSITTRCEESVLENSVCLTSAGKYPILRFVINSPFRAIRNIKIMMRQEVIFRNNLGVETTGIYPASGWLQVPFSRALISNTMLLGRASYNLGIQPDDLTHTRQILDIHTSSNNPTQRGHFIFNTEIASYADFGDNIMSYSNAYHNIDTASWSGEPKIYGRRLHLMVEYESICGSCPNEGKLLLPPIHYGFRNTVRLRGAQLRVYNNPVTNRLSNDLTYSPVQPLHRNTPGVISQQITSNANRVSLSFAYKMIRLRGQDQPNVQSSSVLRPLFSMGSYNDQFPDWEFTYVISGYHSVKIKPGWHAFLGWNPYTKKYHLTMTYMRRQPNTGVLIVEIANLEDIFNFNPEGFNRFYFGIEDEGRGQKPAFAIYVNDASVFINPNDIYVMDTPFAVDTSPFLKMNGDLVFNGYSDKLDYYQSAMLSFRDVHCEYDDIIMTRNPFIIDPPGGLNVALARNQQMMNKFAFNLETVITNNGTIFYNNLGFLQSASLLPKYIPDCTPIGHQENLALRGITYTTPYVAQQDVSTTTTVENLYCTTAQSEMFGNNSDRI